MLASTVRAAAWKGNLYTRRLLHLVHTPLPLIIKQQQCYPDQRSAFTPQTAPWHFSRGFAATDDSPEGLVSTDYQELPDKSKFHKSSDDTIQDIPENLEERLILGNQHNVGGTAASNLMRFLALLGATFSGALGFAGAAYAYVDEAEHGLPPPKYPWPHHGVLSSYDHPSIRRGHQVYQQVCANCHSMSLVAFRDLIGVAYTEEEVKAIAAEYEVLDGPNDEGEMYPRPGKPSDRFPDPYPNEQAARFANGGAYPPDLSLITKARYNGQNYVFTLITGYHDPPAGVSIREGLYYNPYFPGGAIAMPKPLNYGAVEYEDGAPATESQMAKDVTTFLSWAAEPEMEERKLMGFKVMWALFLALIQAAYYKRWKWAPVKTRRVVLDVIN